MNKILFCGIIWISGKLLLHSHKSSKLDNIIWTGQQVMILIG